MPQTTRREFLTRAALAAAGPVALARPAAAVGPTWPSHFQLSLADSSFRDLLTGPNTTMDLFGPVDLAAELGLNGGIEPISYYFSEHVTTAELHRLKRHAFLRGLDVNLVNILEAFESSQLAQLKRAVDGKDRAAFEAVYEESLTVCYPCHKAADKPYLHPQAPGTPASRIINSTPRPTGRSEPRRRHPDGRNEA
jgi:hypothetical protein